MFALRVSRWGRFNRPIANSPEGTPKANFVSKDRLYDVVLDSHKPSVRLFARGLFQLTPLTNMWTRRTNPVANRDSLG